MKFTRSNFKETRSRLKFIYKAYWKLLDERAKEREEFNKKYDALLEEYFQVMRDRIDFMQEITEAKISEIDLYIERERADREYLSREGLEVRFQNCKYRQN
jgi:predicted AlkP superfamily phosphohydrolase/phosphomutase